MNYADIYDHIYTHSSVYQEETDVVIGRATKDPIVLRVIEVFSPPTLVDLGCGQGYYVKKLKQEFGIETFGVEASRVCCEKYLKGLPHVNKDIRAFLETKAQFDFVLCTDVMEHIVEDEIDAILSEAARTAPVALYGIANHSDVQEGIQLHVTARPSEWWVDRLSRHYAHVQTLAQLYDGLFFFILCCDAGKKDLASRV